MTWAYYNYYRFGRRNRRQSFTPDYEKVLESYGLSIEELEVLRGSTAIKVIYEEGRKKMQPLRKLK